MKLHVELFLHTSIKNIVVVHKGNSHVFIGVIYSDQKGKIKVATTAGWLLSISQKSSFLSVLSI